MIIHTHTRLVCARASRVTHLRFSHWKQVVILQNHIITKR